MLLDSGVGGKAELLEKHVDFLVQKFSIFLDRYFGRLFIHIHLCNSAHTCSHLCNFAKVEQV
jgi:fructose-1,6-bisphosphatase